MLAGLLWLVACSANPVDTITREDTGDDADLEGPTISHDAISDPQAYGQDVYIEARASDPSGVQVFTLYYQRETDATWKQKIMNFVGGDLYQGTISGTDVSSGGMRYYLEAIDTLDNASCLPEDCDGDPWHFAVTAR